MKISNQLAGHIAVFTAYLIFGFNIIICKDIANSGFISPYGLFCLRAIGAASLFWMVSLFLPKEKVEKKDMIRIFFASLLGLIITQLTFLKGITITTPLDCSLICILAPVFTMFVAAAILKEPITFKKAFGVALSFVGVLVLILNSTSLGGGADKTQPLGIILLIINALSFALYLGIFRPLIAKYSVVTFMKWMFFFAVVVSVPFCFKEISTLNYTSFPSNYYAELGYLILFSTFIAYFLIPIGQKHLRPTVVSLYSYLQPLIATIVSIYIGMDVVTWQKVVAAGAILSGVILVNRSRAAHFPQT